MGRIATGVRRACRAPVILALVVGLAGCGRYLLFDPRAEADRIAAAGALAPSRIETPAFVLRAYLRAPRAAKTLVVYIEGDGRAWESRSQPSPDPTPTDPVALRMAAEDTAPAVLYLARPCQYVRNEDARGCTPAYWTERRFAPEVLASLNLAVDRAVARLGASRVVLIGYSGGGTVAALLAERRADAVGLATVAGVLDHRAWTRHHGVSPLDGSDNPADHLDRLARVAQWHFVGADDPVVPPDLPEAVVARMGRPRTVRVVRLDGFDHACCWDEAWPRLRRRLDPVVRP